MQPKIQDVLPQAKKPWALNQIRESLLWGFQYSCKWSWNIDKLNAVIYAIAREEIPYFERQPIKATWPENETRSHTQNDLSIFK